MLYVEAVTKVFQANFAGLHIDQVKDRAYEAGYEALTFNNEVYVKAEYGNVWIKTPFVLSDFVAMN